MLGNDRHKVDAVKDNRIQLKYTNKLGKGIVRDLMIRFSESQYDIYCDSVNIATLKLCDFIFCVV